MRFVVESDVQRPATAVFGFLRDIHKLPRDPGSVVPVLEMTSPGEVGVGSTFHEVVRLTRHARAEIDSVITDFGPPRDIAYRFTWRCGPARMAGTLRYRVDSTGPSCAHLRQEQTLEPAGALRLLSPLIERAFGARVAQRMRDLKQEMEAGVARATSAPDASQAIRP